ncbi:MAG: hypothetical protein ABID87_05510 [Chloroflexota bacterium]
MEKETLSRSKTLRITGAAVAGFSLLFGLFSVFVLSNCSFVGSLVLAPLTLAFIGGGIVFGIGQLISRRDHLAHP